MIEKIVLRVYPKDCDDVNVNETRRKCRWPIWTTEFDKKYAYQAQGIQCKKSNPQLVRE